MQRQLFAWLTRTGKRLGQGKASSVYQCMDRKRLKGCHGFPKGEDVRRLNEKIEEISRGVTKAHRDFLSKRRSRGCSLGGNDSRSGGERTAAGSRIEVSRHELATDRGRYRKKSHEHAMNRTCRNPPSRSHEELMLVIKRSLGACLGSNRPHLSRSFDKGMGRSSPDKSRRSRMDRILAKAKTNRTMRSEAESTTSPEKQRGLDFWRGGFTMKQRECIRSQLRAVREVEEKVRLA